MDVSQCEHLDEYLDGCLADEQAERFRAHLCHCPACRREVERQEEVDRLLARGTRLLGPVPSLLTERIQRQFEQAARRRAVRWAAGLSAAAILVLAVGIGVVVVHFGSGPQPQETARQDLGGEGDRADSHLAGQPTSSAQSDVEVTLDDPADAIVVPLRTDSPRVSIVWIYPTVKSAAAVSGPGADGRLSQ